MTAIPYRTALIVGAGPGISASVSRGLAAAGLKVGLAARNIDKLASLAAETGAERFAVDASDPAAVALLFEAAEARLGAPDLVLYNASARAHGPIAEHDPEGPWRHPADRRQRQRQGLPVIGGLCDGQVCLARSGPEHRARIGAEGHPCRAFRDRRRRAQCAAAGSDGSAGQHARPGRDRPDLSGSVAATAQRLVARSRDAALGRDFLTPRARPWNRGTRRRR